MEPEYDGKQNKLVRERQIPYDFIHMWNLRTNEQRGKKRQNKNFNVSIVFVLRSHELHPYKIININDKCCVCSIPLTGCSPSPSLFSGSLAPEHNNTEISQLVTLQWSLSVQVKGKVTCDLNDLSNLNHFKLSLGRKAC